MRSAPLLALVLAMSSTAAADPIVAYGLDPELIPVQCRAAVTGTRAGARISLASCVADHEIEKLSLDASASAVAAMAAAVHYSMQLFDSVIATGTPIERVEALRARADLYTGMVSRMRRTATSLNWHTTGEELAHAQALHDSLEIAIAPWLRAAAADDDMVLRISRAHPEVLRDPIARIAVRRATPQAIVTRR